MREILKTIHEYPLALPSVGATVLMLTFGIWFIVNTIRKPQIDPMIQHELDTLRDKSELDSNALRRVAVAQAESRPAEVDWSAVLGEEAQRTELVGASH